MTTLELISALKESITKDMVYLCDTSIDLAERYAYFVQIAEYMPTKSYQYNLPNGIGLYDDLSYEKYETISIPSLITRIENQKLLTTEQLNAFKEECLAAGFGGFQYDW